MEVHDRFGYALLDSDFMHQQFIDARAPLPQFCGLQIGGAR
jgi:hypothetical protein